MSFSRTNSFQVDASGAHLVHIDVDNHGAEFRMKIVGLGDKAVAESEKRVLAALRNAKHFTALNRMGDITVSLAPAELPKHGPAFDLPIAIGVLKSIALLPLGAKDVALIGELGLDGTVRPVRGVIAAALAARELGIATLIVPDKNATEAALVHDVCIIPVHTLDEAVRHLLPEGAPAARTIEALPPTELEETSAFGESYLDIIGQETAKRGLLIAAAGGHNLALFGPPGTGKTLLARALVELLPALSHEQVLETTMTHSLAGVLKSPHIVLPPFRAPHHTASAVAVIGGGPNLRPGEIALAHNGVLFLDEFPEFTSQVIEALREPLEDGRVRIARAKGLVQYATRFTLVAAMNPCPCGFAGDQKRACTCTPNHLAHYRRKLSGPIVDRIDMWIEVPRIEHERLLEDRERDATPLRMARAQVVRAHEIANARQGEGKLNARLSGAELSTFAPLDAPCRDLLARSATALDLSGRALHRTIRIARTIADLDESEAIAERHILEALSYRKKKE